MKSSFKSVPFFKQLIIFFFLRLKKGKILKKKHIKQNTDDSGGDIAIGYEPSCYFIWPWTS